MKISIISGLLAWSWLLSGWVLSAENPAALTAYEKALGSFQIPLWDRADREFGEFVEKFPDSSKVPEAILLQAQARFEMKRYDLAIELLTNRLPKAGELTDQYHFWIAEAEYARQNYGSAAIAYRKLLDEFPNSPLRLKAALGEAFAYFKTPNYNRTIELLRDENGAFRQSAQSSTNETAVVNGFLLLGEAYFASQKYKETEETLAQLGNRKLTSDAEYQRQYLMAFSALADNRPDQALTFASNAVAVARASAMPVREANALVFQAEIWKDKKPETAIEIYKQVSQIKDISLNQKHRALLDAVNLMVAHNQLTNAIQHLEIYLAQNSTHRTGAEPIRPSDAGFDVLQLTLGELRLKQFYALGGASSTNTSVISAATNLLYEARKHFDAVISITNSLQIGKAYLNRGWSFWEEAKLIGPPVRLAEAQGAFQLAVERLLDPKDQATARFKLADAQFEQADHTNAIKNYSTILEQFAANPEIKTNFFHQALHQIVRAGVEMADFDRAGQALDRLLKEFPSSPLADDALYFFGQSLLAQRRFAEARQRFDQFRAVFPQSDLLAKVELAKARSFVEERDWSAAASEYNQWLSRFATNALRAQAEFDRAWMFYQANQETNALSAFTNFVEKFPSDPLAPLARYWVAEHFYARGEFDTAELHYKLVAKMAPATNPLVHQARLMASKAALLRAPWDAASMLQDLIVDRACPPAIEAEARFVYGDLLLKQAEIQLESNSAQKNSDPPSLAAAIFRFEEALMAFRAIPNRFPTNRLAMLARGKIGNCYLNLAALDTNRFSYKSATNEYFAVVSSPWADVSTRSQAEVGLGIVLEKIAAQSPNDERVFLDRALNHYMNVLMSTRVAVDKGERPDLFWVKQAGEAAGRLAERLGMTREAIGIYERLASELPQLRPKLQPKLETLKRDLAANQLQTRK